MRQVLVVLCLFVLAYSLPYAERVESSVPDFGQEHRFSVQAQVPGQRLEAIGCTSTSVLFASVWSSSSYGAYHSHDYAKGVVSSNLGARIVFVKPSGFVVCIWFPIEEIGLHYLESSNSFALNKIAGGLEWFKELCDGSPDRNRMYTDLWHVQRSAEKLRLMDAKGAIVATGMSDALRSSKSRGFACSDELLLSSELIGQLSVLDKGIEYAFLETNALSMKRIDESVIAKIVAFLGSNLSHVFPYQDCLYFTYGTPPFVGSQGVIDFGPEGGVANNGSVILVSNADGDYTNISRESGVCLPMKYKGAWAMARYIWNRSKVNAAWSLSDCNGSSFRLMPEAVTLDATLLAFTLSETLWMMINDEGYIVELRLHDGRAVKRIRVNRPVSVYDSGSSLIMYDQEAVDGIITCRYWFVPGQSPWSLTPAALRFQ